MKTLATERKIILLVDEQRFAGSGLFHLKAFGERPDGVVLSSGQDTLERGEERLGSGQQRSRDGGP